MKDRRVLAMCVASFILLIIAFYLFTDEILVIDGGYSNGKNLYELYSSYEYDIQDARLITIIDSSEKISMSQGRRFVEILSENSLLNREMDVDTGVAEPLCKFYEYLYYFTMASFLFVIFSHLLGTKYKGFILIPIGVIWLVVCSELSMCREGMKISPNIFLGVCVMCFSCVFWWIGQEYLPKEKQYWFFEVIIKKKKLWINQTDSGSESVKPKTGDSEVRSSYEKEDKIKESKSSEKPYSSGVKISDDVKRDKKSKINNKKLDLKVIYSDYGMECYRQNNVKKCSKCDSDNTIGNFLCMVCGERL